MSILPGNDRFFGRIIVRTDADLPLRESMKAMAEVITVNLAVKYFGGYGEVAIETPEYSTENTTLFAEYLASNPDIHLFGPGFFVWISPTSTSSYSVDLHGVFGDVSLKALTSIIEKSDYISPYYCCIGASEELWHRNGFRVPARYHPGKFNTGLLGEDINRYIPGLYWLNYFSNTLVNRFQISIKALSSMLEVEPQTFENGCLLRLYDVPQVWMKYKEHVDGVLMKCPSFFCKAHVPIPEIASATEMTKWILEVGNKWR